MRQILTSLLILASACAPAADSGLINYQGKLVRGNNPVTGPVTMVFRVFTSETGGTFFFEETQEVNVANGIYSTLLGKNPSIGSIEDVAKSERAYLEVSINGNPLRPREKFVPPPFARESTRCWNVFGIPFSATGTYPGFDLQFGLGLLACEWAFQWSVDSGMPPAQDEKIISHTFPPSGETCSITSAKVLFTFVGPSSPASNMSVAVKCTLTAVDTVSRQERYVGAHTVYWYTNLPLNTWLPIDVGTNALTRTLAASELLRANFSLSYETPTNAMVSIRCGYMMEVRVK